MGLIIKMVFLIRAIRMCPAVMLAHSRTERVIGRISKLIDSIIVIKWDNAMGVDRGTRWLIKCVVFLKILKSTIASHAGRARDKVNIICLVRVYTYGINLLRFRIKIRINIENSVISMGVLLLLERAAPSSEYM